MQILRVPFLFCFFSFLPVFLYGGENTFRFPEFRELPPELVIPKNAVVSIAPDGTYLLNGKPSFLITVKMAAGNPKVDLQPTAGYPSSLRWLYEAPLTYENAMRLGFDSIGVCASQAWIPSLVSLKRFGTGRGYEFFFRTGLPVHQDMGGFTPWGPGKIATTVALRDQFEPDACNRYHDAHGNHWVPYSVNHPQGRAFYFAHWNNGIDESLDKGGKAFRYELFNEPGYNDPSPYNRNLFAGYLKKKYGTPAAMNRIWQSDYSSFEQASRFRAQGECAGLFIDWGKFMEDSFTALCRDGAALVKKRIPDALVCVQIMGSDNFRFLPNSNINMLEINKHMNCISTPTGGGVSLAGHSSPAKTVIGTPSAPWVGLNALMSAWCFAMADGKPVHDDETYFSTIGPVSLLMEFMRGIGNASIFEWGKRGYEWKTEAEGRRSAERFPWYILNPYAFPVEKFGAIWDIRKKINAAGDFFIPRTRGIERPCAVLISYPTERMSGFTGDLSSNYSSTVASALLFTHYAFDAILEEQLAEGRADRYRVILAPGMKNTYPQTNPRLEKWVRSGGILIGLLDQLDRDEYGNPQETFFDFHSEKADLSMPPEWKFRRHAKIPGPLSGYAVRNVSPEKGWEKIGSCMLRKKLGTGWIYYLGARFPDYSLAAVLGGVFSEHGVEPQAEIVSAEHPDELVPGIEAAAASRDGMYALLLLNHDKYPKRIRIRPPRKYADAEFVGDLFRRERLKKETDGSVCIPVAGEDCIAVVFATEKAVSARSGGKSWAAVPENILSERFRKMPVPTPKVSSLPDFNVNAADLKTLDLRPVANRHFIDGPACDGKGGWTDQGPGRSLEGVPFGIRTFRGIPCDIIRWDMNGGRACLVLDSQRVPAGFGVKRSIPIPVMDSVKSLFFFHTSAWTKNGEHMMSYHLHCRSGKIITIPVIANQNIADWYNVLQNPLRSEVAWKNLAGHGFYCIRWVNPNPEEFIESITLESKSGESIPIVIGITVEKVSPEDVFHPFPADLEVLPWGNLTSDQSKNGDVQIRLRENTSNWAGFHLQRKFRRPFSVPEGKSTFLKFEIRTDHDLFGNAGRPPVLHVNLNGLGPIPFPGKSAPAESGVWRTVQVPLSAWKKYRAGDPVVRISFQYQQMPCSGVSLRNFVFESR